MSRINSTNLQFYSVQCLEVPPEGPIAVPLPTLDWSVSSEYDVNLQSFEQRGFVSQIQAIFIDNSANGGNFIVTCPNTGQQLNIKGNSQAYLLLLAPNPTILQFTSNGGGVTKVALLNFPVTNAVWQTA